MLWIIIEHIHVANSHPGLKSASFRVDQRSFIDSPSLTCCISIPIPCRVCSCRNLPFSDTTCQNCIERCCHYLIPSSFSVIIINFQPRSLQNSSAAFHFAWFTPQVFTSFKYLFVILLLFSGGLVCALGLTSTSIDSFIPLLFICFIRKSGK